MLYFSFIKVIKSLENKNNNIRTLFAFFKSKAFLLLVSIGPSVRPHGKLMLELPYKLTPFQNYSLRC